MKKITRVAHTEFECWYPHSRLPKRRLFAMVYNSLKKMGALMAPVHISHGRCNVQSEKEMFNAFHANPSPSTRRDEFETRVFQITVCLILHEEQFWFSCAIVRRATTPRQ
jgi:hypothetical protein